MGTQVITETQIKQRLLDLEAKQKTATGAPRERKNTEFPQTCKGMGES